MRLIFLNQFKSTSEIHVDLVCGMTQSLFIVTFFGILIAFYGLHLLLL